MLPDMISISSELAAHYYEPTGDNLEEYGQRYGHVSTLSTLRTHLYLRTGALLIAVGERLTAASMKHMSLTEELT